MQTTPADAQALPYPDGSFDVVTSTFGAMFAPDQQATAAELMRVLRPGGRLGMANWTPESWVGAQFALGARPGPPAGRRQRCVPRPARHVQDPLAGVNVQGPSQKLTHGDLRYPDSMEVASAPHQLLGTCHVVESTAVERHDAPGPSGSICTAQNLNSGILP